MFVDNFICYKEWKEVLPVNDGQSYLIQNTNHFDVEFIVMASEPNEEVKGGSLMAGQQLEFKKVSGKLYVKAPVKARLYIELVEE